MKFSALGAEDNEGEQWPAGSFDYNRQRPQCQDSAVPDSWTINATVTHGVQLYKFHYRIDASQSVTFADFLKLVEDHIGIKPLSMSYKDQETGRVQHFEGDSENGSVDDVFYNVVCMAMKNGNNLETVVDSCETLGASASDMNRHVLADSLHPLTGATRRSPQTKSPSLLSKLNEDVVDSCYVPYSETSHDGIHKCVKYLSRYKVGDDASTAYKQRSAFVSVADRSEGYGLGYSYRMQVEALTDLVKKVDRGVETLLQGRSSSLPFSAVQNQLENVQELLQQLVGAKQASIEAVPSAQTQMVGKNNDYVLPTNVVTESEQNRPLTREDHQLYENNCEFLGKDSFLHKYIHCNLCHKQIIGIRYMCGNCVDFDLCAACEDSADCHFPDHVFIKIRRPIPKMELKTKHGEFVPLLKHSLYDEGSACASRAERSGDLSAGAPTVNCNELLKPIKSIMDAEFIEDETVPDGTKFHPGQRFTKSWRIVNSGCRPFNEDTFLKFLWGTKGFVPNLLEVVVPPLLPKQRGKICVDYVSPDRPGFYESHWNFVHKGHLFGHRIWCSIEVIDPNDDMVKGAVAKDVGSVVMEIQEPENGETARVEASSESVECPLKNSARKDESIIDNPLQAGEKSNILSQTATPNNTPFVLSPPKTPEPFDIEEEIIMRSFHDAEDVLPVPKDDNLMTIDSEFTSVGSLCSSDSDGEFVVVPMPSCFLFDQSQVVTGVQRDSRSGSDGSDSSLMFIRSDGEELHSDDLPKMDFGDHDYSKTTTATATSSSAASCDLMPEILHGAADAAVSGSSNGSDDQTASVRTNANAPSANIEMDDNEGVPIQPTDPSSGEPADVIPPIHVRDTPSGATGYGDQASNFSSSDAAAAARFEDATEDSARMVNVLPEGLVSAAATIFNSARSAFEALQRVPSPPSSLGNRSGLPEPASMRGIRSEPTPVPASTANIVPLLFEMGFHDTATNDRLTVKHNGDLEKILDELFILEDKDWYNHRH